MTCLSSDVRTVLNKVEAAWAKYFPQITDDSALFFGDESAEGSKARYNELKAILGELEALQLTKVEERIIRERYRQVVIERTLAYENKAETFWGKYISSHSFLGVDSLASNADDAEEGKGSDELLAAYKAFPKFVDQWIAKMDYETPDYFFQVENLDFDVMQNRLKAWAGVDYVKPFKSTANEKEAAAVAKAFTKLTEVYDPTKSKRKVLRTYNSPSLQNLPNGDKLFEWRRMAHLTSVDEEYSPAALHDTGLKMTDDLNSKCYKAYQKVTNTTAPFNMTSMNDFIRSDPLNYPFKSIEEVVQSYQVRASELNELLPKEFGVFPICPFVVKSCFDLEGDVEENCGGGIGYYMDGTYSGENQCQSAGTYILDFNPNGDLMDFPKSMTTTLLIHETNPGHHMQIMLGHEADPECVPDFIGKAGSLTVMIEGWGLYSETTGFKYGAYDDPLQEIGHYQDRLLRSMRLVADTGLHSKNWTHSECVKYMMANSGFSEQGLVFQCERYAAWPAQALSYMVGSLAYEGARADAEEALKDKFDAPSFHYTLLKYGDMAVEQIEELGNAYVSNQQNGVSAYTTSSNAVAAAPEPAPSSTELAKTNGFDLGTLIGVGVGALIFGLLFGFFFSKVCSKRGRKSSDDEFTSDADLTGKA